jgi:hypothetical protein
MKSNLMTKWNGITEKLTSEYNVYSTNLVLKDMKFPAIVFMPDNQTPTVTSANYSNRILEYRWKLIILLRLSDYSDIIEAQDDAWYLSEQIPSKLGVKIMNSIPFGHVKENKELVCIEHDVVSVR